MEPSKELMERQEAKQRDAFIGLLFFDDESCKSAIILNVQKDPDLEESLRALYKKKRLTHFSLHFHPEGVVEVECQRDLLDGTRLQEFVIRFTPENVDDVDAFLGYLDLEHHTSKAVPHWRMIIRLSKTELHFEVDADSGEVLFSYESSRFSNIRKFAGRE